MEPTFATGQGDLSGLRLDWLRRATERYLQLAYPSGIVPETIQRRLVWREDCTADLVLTAPPFERPGKAPDRSSPIYALRLGNHRYPHMKLQIQPWINEAGFMLSVNTHDQVTGIDLGAAGASIPGASGGKPAAQGGDRRELGRCRPAHLSALSAGLHQKPGRRFPARWVRRKVGEPPRNDRPDAAHVTGSFAPSPGNRHCNAPHSIGRGMNKRH